jgi:hypothetical protein
LSAASCSTTVRAQADAESAAAGGQGGAGGEPVTPDCIVPEDGSCNEDDCDCFVCKGSAMCTPGGCVTDGYCDVGVLGLPDIDSCTCSDCDWNAPCIQYDDVPCDLDGTCEYDIEGCACADCWDAATCLDNVAACAAGQPDGICDPAAESCECADCLATALCFPCLADGVCLLLEPCICPDCSDVCANTPCSEDGLCDWYVEGCHCSDCAGLPLCN